MVVKHLRKIKLILLLLLVLSLLNGGRLTYHLVTNYWQQGAINRDVDKLKSKLSAVSPTKQKYKLFASEISLNFKPGTNLFARRNQPPTQNQAGLPAEPPTEPESDLPPSPPEESSKKNNQQSKEQMPFTVVAISIYETQDKNMAILRNKMTGTTHIVKPGKKISGYQVVSIENGKVILQYKGSEKELALNKGEE